MELFQRQDLNKFVSMQSLFVRLFISIGPPLNHGWQFQIVDSEISGINIFSVISACRAAIH